MRNFEIEVLGSCIFFKIIFLFIYWIFVFSILLECTLFYLKILGVKIIYKIEDINYVEFVRISIIEGNIFTSLNQELIYYPPENLS